MKQSLRKKTIDRLIALSVMMSLFAVSSALAQERVISGKVTDDAGTEMPGVNIILKGTSIGTTTGANGSYNVSIPATENNAVLVFSFIGYQNVEEEVGQRTSIDVKMPTAISELSEVIVVGYGTQSKATVTGAVAEVKGKDLLKVRTPNVINSLTGQIPGVFVNSRTGEPGRENPTILIRGRGTPTDSNPLIIIDGVQRPDLGRINPNDIENISVLKDASAAIYGARAANGVILVTTKRGKTGAPTFNFSYNSGFSQPTRNPKMADSYTYAQVFNENLANPYLDAGNPVNTAGMFTDDQLEKFKAGKEEGYQTLNWYDEMTKTFTPQQQVNISTSGGTEAVNYYIALGYFNQKGHFEQGSTELKRYNFRANTDVKVTSFLKVGMDISGRVDDRVYPGRMAVPPAPPTPGRLLLPWVPDTRGVYSHMWLYRPYWTKTWPGTDYLTPNRDSENIVNWVSSNSGTYDEDYQGLETRLHFLLNVPGVEGLSVRGSANYDVGNNQTKVWSIPTYVYTRTGTSPDYIYTRTLSGSSAQLAALNQLSEQRHSTTLNFQIDYEKSFGKHNVGAMVGYEQMRYDNSYFQAGRTDFPSAVLPQLNVGPADKTKFTNGGSAFENGRRNYFTRLTYDYDRKYLAQFIFRYDGSPQFPEDKRWGAFPGLSLGWRLSEESFMDNVTFIDELKLRASYGEMGNDNVATFQYIAAYGFGNNYVVGGSDVTGLAAGIPPNPDITWEEAKTTNVGFDVTFWGGALSAQFDYFSSERSNILLPRTAVVPDYAGFPALPDENYGQAKNAGFELALTHTKTINKLTYSIGGNISYAKNKVLKGLEPALGQPYQAAAGNPINAKLVYRALGIFKTTEELNAYPRMAGTKVGDLKFEDMNGDGLININDQFRLDETSTPQLMYAINASVRYANFDLSILFQGQEKAISNFYETLDNLNDKNFYFPLMNPNGLGNFLQWRADDHWSYDNPDGNQPRADASNATNNATAPNTHWILDAGFLRLKNVELGYTLPASVSQRIKMRNMRVYVNGNNLALLNDSMKALGFDPETTDYWFYPNQRTINIGATLTF